MAIMAYFCITVNTYKKTIRVTKYYWAVLTFWRDRDKMLAKITTKSTNKPV